MSESVATIITSPGRAVVDARLDEYVRARWPALVRYATALCGDSSEGEELVQSALVRVALRWSFVADKDNPDAYVRRAILNAYLNFWRRIRSRETAMPEVPDATIADATRGIADTVTLRRALRSLPPLQRAVLVLRYLEDCTEQQTADLLGCSIGTVKSQTSKGLAKLREAVEDGGDR